jgi:hypothetical protein
MKLRILALGLLAGAAVVAQAQAHDGDERRGDERGWRSDWRGDGDRDDWRGRGDRDDRDWRRDGYGRPGYYYYRAPVVVAPPRYYAPPPRYYAPARYYAPPVYVAPPVAYPVYPYSGLSLRFTVPLR